MKKVFNKTFAAIMLAIVMVLALFGGLFFVGHGEVASADGKDVTVKIEADTKTFSKGTKFNVTVTVSSSLEGSVFGALTLHIGPTVPTKDSFDETKCGMLTFEPVSSRVLLNKSANIKTALADNSSVKPDKGQYGLVEISVSNDKGTQLACTEEITFGFGITIGSDVADGTKFEIGVSQSNLDSYTIYGVKDPIYANESARFEVIPLTFEVKEPSTVNNLESIKVGQGETETELTDLDTDSTNLAITVKDMNSPIAIYPVLPSDAGGATIKVKKTSDDTDEGTEVNPKEITKFPIPADGKLSIIVTAENGDEKEYILTVTVVDAVLTSLTAKSDTKITGVTEGVQETFDSKTLAYTVIVPSDATKVSITATVSTGNSASSTMALSKTGSCTVPSTGTSGTAFDVTGIADGDTLTIKAQADNGAGTRSDTAYVVTFDVKDVDTAITLTVVGKTTNKTFANDATKATEKSVDYFYLVKGETNAASEVTVTFPTTATKVTLDSVTYTVSKTLAAGEHTVFVTAEAGNTKEYKFILKAYTALQLKSGVTADFMYEEYTSTNVYRRTYKEKGLEHGTDDLEFDRFVIGQIADFTSVNTFLTNFETSVANSIKLYKADGTLIYNLGVPADGFTADDLNKSDSGVGTGWKLEYIVDGDVEETIYLSVLGDLNGDGVADSLDIKVLGNIIKNIAATMEEFNGKEELRLAAYIKNNTVLTKEGTPYVTGGEIVPIGQHTRGEVALSTYFVK
ncbi:MAG: hypothetical protein ACI4MB_01795 [Candidatus Coproplasma sp.]